MQRELIAVGEGGAGVVVVPGVVELPGPLRADVVGVRGLARGFRLDPPHPPRIRASTKTVAAP